MQAAANYSRLRLSRGFPAQTLVGRAAAVYRCVEHSRYVAALSEVQRERTLRQAFCRSEASNLEGAMPGTPLCRDPYARRLVEVLLPASELQNLIDTSTEELAVIEGVSCAFMDRFIMDSLRERMRQVVLFGSGMDCRVFRMELPPPMIFVEVDEGNVHEAKCAALDDTGARARCLVRRQAVDLDANLGTQHLANALAPVLNPKKPTLFLLDGSLSSWPAEARLATLIAAADFAVDGSVIVGPAPDEDMASVLKDAGFSHVNFINDIQLSKIYRRAVPQSMKMLVAIRGSLSGGGGARGPGGASAGGGCRGKSGGPSNGSTSNAKEIRF